MATLQVIGVSDDSPLRNPEQIPYPNHFPLVQNPTGAREEEEDTPSIRELMHVIDSHAELIDLEITNNPNAMKDSTLPQFPDPNAQPAMDMNPVQPNVPQDPTT
nr:hypothetical protein CFP56_44869 [Quercus suber]